MLNIISFSLWGDKPMYGLGAIENAKIAPEIYPGWICKFYCDASVPKNTIEELLKYNAQVSIINKPFGKSYGSWEGLFWRFLPASDPTVDRMISRDTDSILNVREKAAVDEWIESKKPFHIMRDHPWHCVPILGGMWGCIKGFLPEMAKWIYQWLSMEEYRLDLNSKGPDQLFLAEAIWPVVKRDCVTHDEITSINDTFKRPFPKHTPLPKGLLYVGQIIER